MPLTIPSIDDRRYQELLDEALARIPVHTPEWTNFNKSDPGVTLIEVFAFLTENLLYRANQIPERNRRKFLSLLGVPLQPATSAAGLVTLTNQRGPATTITLTRGIEVLAGQTPFRTERGLDVLPIEAAVYYKRQVTAPDEGVKEYYNQLYASFLGSATRDVNQLQLYETVPLNAPGSAGVNLADTVDKALWVALLMRPNDLRLYPTPDLARDAIRETLKGKTLSLGIVPIIAEADRRLAPEGERPTDETLLRFELPSIPESGGLPSAASDRKPTYRPLEGRATTDVLAYPGIVDLALPGDLTQLRLWNNLDPLEGGVGDLPPALEDTNLEERVLTWLRIRPGGEDSAASVKAQFLWVGINATPVQQRARVSNELLPSGTGEPDQTLVLARRPVLPGSVRLTVTDDGKPVEWREIDDLLSAASEVPTVDARQAPGVIPTPPSVPLVNVYTLDPESGTLRFGDGLHGRRPPLGATIRADYDYSEGREGNVGAGSMSAAPTLPAGLQVTNPVRTWGGAEAETVSQGERQITRYLQHRDRLVTVADFETITRRTPGVDIARVEILPTFNPELAPSEGGDAPGAVTVMVIPRYDPVTPDAPRPDRVFLDQVCAYLSPRRLVTTEIFVRGPKYKPVWVSLGIRVAPEFNAAEIRETVRQVVRRYLSPQPTLDITIPLAATPRHAAQGWPLSTPLVGLELLTEVARVEGVLSVTGVEIAEGANPAAPSIDFRGLELPELKGVVVSIGDPVPMSQVRGDSAASAGQTPVSQSVIVPVPFIPEECR